MTLSASALEVLLRMADGEDLTDRDGHCWFVRPGGMKNWEAIPFQTYLELTESDMIRVAWRMFGGSELEITPQGWECAATSQLEPSARPTR